MSKSGLLPDGLPPEMHKQAKQMEREQIIDFANNYGFTICGYDYEKADEYYEETHGK